MTLLRIALVLVCLCAPVAAQSPMGEAERDAFRAEVRAYLLENPEVLVEAMDALQAREATAGAERDLALLDTHGSAIFDDPASWSGGNPDGDITIVEFVDYRCGYCRKAAPEVQDLVRTDGNIRFVLKEYPILGEESLLAARYAIAVLQIAGPEAYSRAHDALYAFRGDMTVESLTRLAESSGLDAGAVIARMDSPAVAAVIEANHALGQTLQINGTPTFVIDRVFVRGYVPLDGLRQIVDEQRAG